LLSMSLATAFFLLQYCWQYWSCCESHSCKHQGLCAPQLLVAASQVIFDLQAKSQQANTTLSLELDARHPCVLKLIAQRALPWAPMRQGLGLGSGQLIQFSKLAVFLLFVAPHTSAQPSTYTPAPPPAANTSNSSSSCIALNRLDCLSATAAYLQSLRSS
jgi:hypothetical protein